MRNKLSAIKLTICLVLCIAVCIAAPCMAFAEKEQEEEALKTVLKIWQIDSFEGGKGSRADFLQKIGDDFTKISGCYVNVISVSAEAARLNLSNGNVPDLISYGAGIYGLESYITEFSVWCHGGYCFLAIDAGADFSDITSENTVINEGKDNLVGAAALFCGVEGATYKKPTGAYVSLINGEYKYLLGTQRDVFRLKTRGVSFSVLPVTAFNDLYQDVSVTATGERAVAAKSFSDYLLTRSDEVNRLGMLCFKTGLYDDEMRAMEGLNYEYTLISPVSGATKAQLDGAIKSGDINSLKNLLK